MKAQSAVEEHPLVKLRSGECIFPQNTYPRYTIYLQGALALGVKDPVI